MRFLFAFILSLMVIYQASCLPDIRYSAEMKCTERADGPPGELCPNKQYGLDRPLLRLSVPGCPGCKAPAAAARSPGPGPAQCGGGRACRRGALAPWE